ncbi:hypothetical protein ABK040_006706 [Willaertia magna]
MKDNTLTSLPDEIFSIICLYLDDKDFLTFQKVSKSISESIDTFGFLFLKERLLNKFKYWKNHLALINKNNNSTFSLQKMLQNEETVRQLYKSSHSKYLIVGKDGRQWMTAIQTHCKELGLQNVDIFDTEKKGEVPTLEFLKDYSSVVLVGDNCTFIDKDHASQLSESLCKYLLNGYGGVVVNVFANCSNVTSGYLQHSFENFHPITPTTQRSGFSGIKMTPDNTNYEDHFLLIGYQDFVMEAGDHSHGQLFSKTKEFDEKTIGCIARFTDTEKIPAIATRKLPLDLIEKHFPDHLKYISDQCKGVVGTGRICELNFFPVDGWSKLSEGSKLIVNALLYCTCLLKNK